MTDINDGEFERRCKSFQNSLEKENVPVNLAASTARILALESMGLKEKRTPEEQHLVSSAWRWQFARRGGL